MIVNLEDSRPYKGGCWSNAQSIWFDPRTVYGNKRVYSSGGLGFRTSIAGRTPLNREAR